MRVPRRGQNTASRFVLEARPSVALLGSESSLSLTYNEPGAGRFTLLSYSKPETDEDVLKVTYSYEVHQRVVHEGAAGQEAAAAGAQVVEEEELLLLRGTRGASAPRGARPRRGHTHRPGARAQARGSRAQDGGTRTCGYPKHRDIHCWRRAVGGGDCHYGRHIRRPVPCGPRHPAAVLTAALHGHPAGHRGAGGQTRGFSGPTRDGTETKAQAPCALIASFCSASRIQSVSSKYTLVLKHVIFTS